MCLGDCSRSEEESDEPHCAMLSSNAHKAGAHVRILIAGMPNVGKSSLLNSFRRYGANKGAAGVSRLLIGIQATAPELMLGLVPPEPCRRM